MLLVRGLGAEFFVEYCEELAFGGGVEVRVDGVLEVVGVLRVEVGAQRGQQGLDAVGQVKFVFGFPVRLIEQDLQFAGDVVEPGQQVWLVGARGAGLGGLQPAVEVLGQHDGRRVVKDQRRRKIKSGGRFEPVAQLDGGQ